MAKVKIGEQGGCTGSEMKPTPDQTPDQAHDEFTIPAPLLRELAETVDHFPSGSLLALARQSPDLGRGLRPTAANAKFIRKRLAARLADPGQLTDEIRLFLSLEGLNGQLVMVLSTAVLRECLPELLALYGRERMLAALVVDSRDEVRRMVAEYCQTEDWQTRPLPDRDPAIATLSERLSPFLSAIAPLRGESPLPGTPGAPGGVDAGEGRQGELEGYRQKVAALSEQLREARDQGKAERKIDQKLADLKAQVSELTAKLSRERQARVAADSALAQAKADLAGVREAEQEAIRAGVEAEMRSVVRGWLATPARIDREVEALSVGSGADLLDRVRAALVSQVERDRHFGNRARLRQRLTDLRQAEEGLLRAAAEAINPLPELAGLVSELGAEASRIEELLAERGPMTPVTTRLAALIRQADNQGTLARIKRLLHDLEGCGCLTPLESQALYRDYHDGLGRLFDRFAPSPLTATRESDPALAVTRGVAGEGRFLWLLDGYNILFGLPELFAQDFAEGRPTARAREHLLTLVERRLAGSESLAEVFFDGEVSHQENFSPRVRVIYSGGGGTRVRNRADQAIIDWLESQPALIELGPIVVTNDRELAARCRALQVRVMPLPQFAALLTP